MYYLHLDDIEIRKGAAYCIWLSLVSLIDEEDMISTEYSLSMLIAFDLFTFLAFFLSNPSSIFLFFYLDSTYMRGLRTLP